MIDPELLAKLEEISAKADKAYRAAETARKYLFWTGVVSIALVIIPLTALVFAIPQFIDIYTNTLNGIGY